MDIENHGKKLAKASLIVWLCILLMIIAIHRPSSRYEIRPFVNLVPFVHLIDLMKGRIESWRKDSSIILYLSFYRSIRPWLYNLLFYVWPGFIVPFIYKKNVKLPKLLAGCAIFSFLVNLIRLLSKCGSFDVDDMILNLCGFSIGYFLYSRIIAKKGNVANYTF